MPLDLSKFRKDIERELKKAGQDAIATVTHREKRYVGQAAIAEIRTLVRKGISPIAGAGRFPAYKWVGRANAALKIARRLTKERRKDARAIANSIKSRRYPYSVQGEFPDKRERPVNLNLSGEFLDSLRATPTSTGVAIGFDNELSELKESGHREGVNDQPRRPIIPQGREQFSPSIYRRIVDVVREIFQNKVKGK